MSKWTISKIENQVKFGDFVSLAGDIDINDKIFDTATDNAFFIYKRGSYSRDQWLERNLSSFDIKFYDRQGNEILPEPEYKYVQCESSLEVCELMIKDEALYDKRGNRHRGAFTVDYVGDNWREFFKRVEV